MEFVKVTQMLRQAERGGYGVGAFSARNFFDRICAAGGTGEEIAGDRPDIGQ